MNQSQMNRKHMVEATLSFLNGNTANWQRVAKMNEAVTKLGGINLAIDAAATRQMQAQVNAGEIKSELKFTICQKADILNDVVEVYAQMTGDEMLAQTMAGSANDLLKLKNDDMLRRVKQIIDAAVEKQEDLIADYGLSADQITELQADYDRFLELNGLPREYTIQSAVATLTLEELFTEVADLLTNQLDNLMKIFKRSDPTFYNGYLQARIVVNY
jgi:hypothetical protein